MRQCAFPRPQFLRLSYSPTPSARGTFLKHINRFDNIEFGIGNKDGRSLVMATRKLVELSFLAMQDAGIEYRGKRIGSFMCGTSTEHWTPVSAPTNHVNLPFLTFARLGDNKRADRCDTCEYACQSCFICPGSHWPLALRGYGMQLIPDCPPSRFKRDKRRGVRCCLSWWLPAEYQVGLFYQRTLTHTDHHIQVYLIGTFIQMRGFLPQTTSANLLTRTQMGWLSRI